MEAQDIEIGKKYVNSRHPGVTYLGIGRDDEYVKNRKLIILSYARNYNLDYHLTVCPVGTVVMSREDINEFGGDGDGFWDAFSKKKN